MSTEKNFKYTIEDKEKFYTALKNCAKYQVGDEYYFLSSGKIIHGMVNEVTFRSYDHGMVCTTQRRLTIDVKIVLVYGAGKFAIPPHQLYETREEAADQFLKDNDVPAELLKVLKVEKPKTTVGDLIEKLQRFNPKTDLGESFNSALNPVIKKAVYGLDEDGDPLVDCFWRCECVGERFVHHHSEEWCPECETAKEDQPKAFRSQIIPKNLFCLK